MLFVELPKLFVDAPKPEPPPKPVDAGVDEPKPLEDPKLFVVPNPPVYGEPNAGDPLEGVVVEGVVP